MSCLQVAGAGVWMRSGKAMRTVLLQRHQCRHPRPGGSVARLMAIALVLAAALMLVVALVVAFALVLMAALAMVAVLVLVVALVVAVAMVVAAAGPWTTLAVAVCLAVTVMAVIQPQCLQPLHHLPGRLLPVLDVLPLPQTLVAVLTLPLAAGASGAPATSAAARAEEVHGQQSCGHPVGSSDEPGVDAVLLSDDFWAWH